MVPLHQLGIIIMSELLDNQLNDIVGFIIDEYGTQLSGDEVSEIIGLIMENIPGLEVFEPEELTITINDIRKRYYESTH